MLLLCSTFPNSRQALFSQPDEHLPILTERFQPTPRVGQFKKADEKGPIHYSENSETTKSLLQPHSFIRRQSASQKLGEAFHEDLSSFFRKA